MTWLDDAKQITRTSRELDYGTPLVNHLRIALMWSAFLGVVITPVQVVWMMVLIKMMREVNSHKADNYIDAMGYLDCVQRMDDELQALGYMEGIRVVAGYDVPLGLMRRILEEAEHKDG